MTATSKNSAAKTAANGAGGEVKDAAGFVPRDAVEAKYRDFFWTYTEEPHRTRRLAIIKAHPEVLGPDHINSPQNH